MRFKLLISLVFLFGAEYAQADDEDLREMMTRFGPRGYPSPTASDYKERFARSYRFPPPPPSSFPSSADSDEKYPGSFGSRPNPPAYPYRPTYPNRFPGTPDSMEKFGRSYPGSPDPFRSRYSPYSNSSWDSNERFTRSFPKPSPGLSRPRTFGGYMDSKERFERSYSSPSSFSSSYPLSRSYSGPRSYSPDSSERFTRSYPSSPRYPAFARSYPSPSAADSSIERLKRSYPSPASGLRPSYPFPRTYPSPSVADSSDEKSKRSFPSRPLPPSPPNYPFPRSFSSPSAADSSLERFKRSYTPPAGGVSPSYPFLNSFSGPPPTPDSSLERFKRSYPGAPNSNPRFPRSSASPTAYTPGTAPKPQSYTFNSVPMSFPTWSAGRLRRQPDPTDRNVRSPLIDFPDGQELTDDDCIPNDGSDTGEGEQRSTPWQTWKDECYGVYSPRCTMFNRMMSGYNSGPEAEAENEEPGARSRRMAELSSEYDPETDTYNFAPDSAEVSAAAGGSSQPRKRFRRDLSRGLGFPSSSFPMGRRFGSMRAPFRRQADSPTAPSPADNAGASAGTGPVPPNAPVSPTRTRVKCPERRVLPEYAYWKTRLPEDLRRSEMLLGSKKLAAVRQNQEAIGKKR